MADKVKEKEKLVRGDDEILFDDYINRKRFGSKFWLLATLTFFFILAVVIYKVCVLDKIIPPEEIKASIEIFDIDSQWLVKEEVHEKDYNGVVIVPQISFRFRNMGKNNLKYVYVLSVFRILNRARALGEGYEMSLMKPLEPGKESERIVLTSSTGYRTTSKETFARNPHEWKSAAAEIYVRSSSSQFVFLKSFYIMRKIKGLDSDIEIKIS